jgi:hypothetical protein
MIPTGGTTAEAMRRRVHAVHQVHAVHSVLHVNNLLPTRQPGMNAASRAAPRFF